MLLGVRIRKLLIWWSDCLGTILLSSLVFCHLGCAGDQVLDLVGQTLQHVVLLVVVLHVESARPGGLGLSLARELV